jgi:protoporphyrinogen oxidase
MKKEIVIVGGGIAGLLSALLFSKNTNYKIYLIEKDKELGGLLKAFDYGEFGKFDYGAHNILETGINELDEILIGLLDEWDISTAINGQKRTLTGLFYNGKLQHGSPYIDLRDKVQKFKNSFFEKRETLPYRNAYEFSKQLFGSKITDHEIVPIFLKLYGVHPEKMSDMTMYLTPLTRVVLFNNEELDKYSEEYEDVLAYSNQEKMPKEKLSPLKAYYPKKYGIYRVIEALKNKVIENGVDIHLETELKNIEYKNGKVEKISFKNIEVKNLEYLVWSVGLNSLASSLNLDLKFEWDQAPKTVITNILIDKPLNAKKLSYFYNYDPKFKTFRVDNYSNYSSGAVRNDLYPISVEMLLYEVEENIDEVAIRELKKSGVLQENTKIVFKKSEVLKYGFPLLTEKNISNTNILREKIKNLKLDNLVSLGILSEENLFFESDIKKHTYKKIKEILKG